jgi:hypothetical protein
MVSQQSIEKQLKRIGFKRRGWGKGEIDELQHIILPDEEIYECVNGIYEGGFALLLATDVRVLLIDKKPLNFLTVEDLRFEMINELDYSHRLFGAQINIASGNKTLRFRSYNQPRLRKLITHVQHCMAEAKKKQSSHQEGQNLHLEQINQQLQTYLIAQYQQQPGREAPPLPDPIEPSNQLSDYLFAQSLLAQHQQGQAQSDEATPAEQPLPVLPIAVAPTPVATEPPTQSASAPVQSNDAQLDDIYADGIQEVFGKHQPQAASAIKPSEPESEEIIPMHIAYSKLPMALRSRKFGRRLLFPTP